MFQVAVQYVKRYVNPCMANMRPAITFDSGTDSALKAMLTVYYKMLADSEYTGSQAYQSYTVTPHTYMLTVWDPCLG